MWEKFCADPGDLLVWDSRTPYYNIYSTTLQSRFCIYICYMPVTDDSQEDLIRKSDAFTSWVGTTHWPTVNYIGDSCAKREVKDDPSNRFEPMKKSLLDERIFKLTEIP